MYSDTITLFNRYESRLGDVWFPTVIHGVDLNIDKAAILEKYGAESQDKATLNIRYRRNDNSMYVADKKWLPPKEWDRQTNDMLPKTLTFASGGQYFDFFIKGVYAETVIQDSDYDEGLYQYLLDRLDYVFAISSVAIYSVIPHFEILAR